MAKWCNICLRNGNNYVGCDNTCPAFGKDFGELAVIAIKYEELKSVLTHLKDLAESVRYNEDSVFADYRNVAEYDKNEIINTLIELEL